MTLGRIVHS